ncbi:hypothetical protein VTP01DRAFT_8952 [Rhizomucor pusillus]|uniref:uncharacterized protein n=1 Tax=Rhizomucor pusillus TaxID=4840 RepID=UPI00374320D6
MQVFDGAEANYEGNLERRMGTQLVRKPVQLFAALRWCPWSGFRRGLCCCKRVPTNGAWNKSSQLIIKRGYLYGRTIPNRDWLETRRSVNNIDDIEAALSEGSTRSTYARYQTYLQTLKANDNSLRLWNFYSNRSVRRRVWDNAISQRLCLDKACYLVMNQANNTLL